MPFKIAQSQTYQQDIEVAIVGETGKIEKHKFKVTFKRCEGDELDELRKKTGREVMNDVLMDWSGVLDGDNEPVEFNADSLNALLQIPAAAHALVKGFWDSIIVAPAKN